MLGCVSGGFSLLRIVGPVATYFQSLLLFFFFFVSQLKKEPIVRNIQVRSAVI